MTPTVLITGLAVRSAAGPGLAALYAATTAGRPLFRPVDRFAAPSAAPAAAMEGSPELAVLLAEVVAEARARAGCPAAPLLLAAHADQRTGALVEAVDPAARVYTGACVAASTAVADAAAAIRSGRQDRVVVAAGYLVERDTYALFAAGRALARDGAVRPFSRGRTGVLLGDAVVAVVLESSRAAGTRAGRALARLAGWGRAGDAYHVCRPMPGGEGLARAARSALARAHLSADRIDYVNANGAGSALGDRSESAALRLLFGEPGSRPPVGATKSVHGHALEASALLEMAVTIAGLAGGSPSAAPPRDGGALSEAEVAPSGANGTPQAPRPGVTAPTEAGRRAAVSSTYPTEQSAFTTAGGAYPPGQDQLTATGNTYPTEQDQLNTAGSTYPTDQNRLTSAGGTSTRTADAARLPVRGPGLTSSTYRPRPGSSPRPAGSRTTTPRRPSALPATAGWLGPDPECGVRPLLPSDPAPDRAPIYALSLNAAFGGANTALLLATP